MASKTGARLSWVQRAALRIAGLKAAGQSFTTTDPRLMALLGPSFAGVAGVSKSGQVISEDSAMRLSVSWACMRVLSETLGSIPWAVYERAANGSAEKREDLPVSDVFVYSPNADMTSVEFREAMTLNLCRNGNAFARIGRTGNEVTSLYPLEAARMEIKRREDDAPQYVYSRPDGRKELIPRENIWHVKGFGSDGIVGLSPIGAAREALGFALATEEFGSMFFAQGGKPSGIVSIPNWLTADQREVARANLQQMMGGNTNAHKFALFEGGMKPEPWGAMPLEDMEFVALRKFSIQEICRFYRVPPHMVADLDRATFSNIEHMSQEFVQFTLLPYFTRFEAAFSKWLIPAEQRGKLFLRLNFEGLLRADSAGRSAFYSTMVQNGIMTRNEIRAKENLNRSTDEGMDDFTAQTNLAPIDKLGAPPPSAPGAGSSASSSLGRPASGDGGGDSAGKPPPPTKENIIVVNPPHRDEEPSVKLILPEGVARETQYSVDHPALRKMLAEQRAAEQRSGARLKELESNTKGAVRDLEQAFDELSAATAASIKALAEATAASIKEVERVARLPRKPVFDDKGEIIGAIPVDSLPVTTQH